MVVSRHIDILSANAQIPEAWDNMKRKIKKKNKRKNKSANLGLEEKIEFFFDKFITFLAKKKEVQNLMVAVESFKNKFRPNGYINEELKIFASVIFIVWAAMWLGSQGSAPIAYSDEITNAQPKESMTPEKIESDSGILNIKNANEYKIKPTEKGCDEYKEQKVSSSFCKKDDEEMMKKIEREENEEEIFVSRPRAIVLSCQEKNYGRPSKSDGKGKHMDEDCCPDPDEWPKPGCVYDAKGYSIMLKGPK